MLFRQLHYDRLGVSGGGLITPTARLLMLESSSAYVRELDSTYIKKNAKKKRRNKAAEDDHDGSITCE